MKNWLPPVVGETIVTKRKTKNALSSSGCNSSVEPPIVKFADGRRGSDYTSPRYPTNLMRWERVDHKADHPDDLVVYNNYHLYESLKHKVRKRVAWLGESPAIAPWTYDFLEDNLEAFDHVLTYDQSIVAMDPERCFYVPRGECWIEPDQVALYPKNRLVSFLSSDKEFKVFSAPGHGLRMQLFHILRRKRGYLGSRLVRSGVMDSIDIYGSIAGAWSPTKMPSLKDYMFQISVENIVHDAYFTEKLIDCFATGTIPIYYGTRELGDFFNLRGMMFFDNLEELTEILVNLSQADYLERMDAVQENFERATAFFSREELICRHSDLLNW